MVTSAAGILSVNLRDIYGSGTVTTAAGVIATALDWGRVLNQNSTVAMSSVSFSTQSVTVGSVNVSSFAGGAVVTSASGILTVNVSTLYGSNFVTTAAGVLGVGRVGVSSIDQRVGVSSFGLAVGVSSFNVGLQTGVSSISVPVGVSSVTDKGGYGVSSISDKAGYGVSSISDKTGYRLDAIGSAAFTEGYAADGATATLPQILYLIQSYLMEKQVTGLSLYARQLDGSTTSATFTLDSSTSPTSITRAS